MPAVESASMSQPYRYALSVMALVLLCGCTPTAKRGELDDRVQKSFAGSFPDKLYYTGSDGTYDYYVLENGLGSSRQTYKVLQGESVEDPRTPVTEDRAKWRFAGPSKSISEYMLKHGDDATPPPASQPDISKFHF
ncbi:MAG: hypothetical protein JWP03_4792 [Phycisphaerales bacterium]|jgi:hypothetical protein|nr:hypothetical protein [Phycisphaerales bacterium]